MIGIKRYITESSALQDIDNLEDAQVISLDDTEAIYRVDKTNNRIESITSPTLGIVPPGTIITYIGSTVPEGYLPCTGVEYDTTQYPKLYTLLKSNKTPDLRELYLVGAGLNSDATIKGHDEVKLAEFKEDQLQGHGHTNGAGALTVASGGYGLDGGGLWYGNVYNRALTTFVDSGNGAPRYGNVTRPKSFGINYLIRAV